MRKQWLSDGLECGREVGAAVAASRFSDEENGAHGPLQLTATVGASWRRFQLSSWQEFLNVLVARNCEAGAWRCVWPVSAPSAVAARPGRCHWAESREQKSCESRVSAFPINKSLASAFLAPQRPPPPRGSGSQHADALPDPTLRSGPPTHHRTRRHGGRGRDQPASPELRPAQSAEAVDRGGLPFAPKRARPSLRFGRPA